MKISNMSAFVESIVIEVDLFSVLQVAFDLGWMRG